MSEQYRNEQFASDNFSGICPEAWAAMAQANEQDDSAYGDDAWTLRAANLFRTVFETDCDVYFVFNGTAANSLSLASMCQSYHAVICHELAHIETDECGGPEFASNGSKLLLGHGKWAQLDLDSIESLITKRSDIHYPKAKVLSLTQSTELGTVYSESKTKSLSELAKQYGLGVHMDGARFANAVAASGKSPAALTWQSGVDVLCFSGTKNGLAMGEAILFFNKKYAVDFAYRCKQAGQLASKMRFISAPWCGLLENETWLKNARHANQMAGYLAQGLESIPHVKLLAPVEANAVFASLPSTWYTQLRQQGWQFYNFIGAGGARFICSWATHKERIDTLLTTLRNISSVHKKEEEDPHRAA